MIFKQWQQVLGGTKTQTRRLRTLRDEFDAMICVEPFRDTVFRKGVVKWRVGNTYAVQPGRGKKAVGRTPPIKVIRRERLGDISAADVFAEGLGIYSVSDGNWYPVTALDVAQEMYAQLWNSIYGPGAWERMMDDDVWALEFKNEGSET